jgi:hypothetical protein
MIFSPSLVLPFFLLVPYTSSFSDDRIMDLLCHRPIQPHRCGTMLSLLLLSTVGHRWPRAHTSLRSVVCTHKGPRLWACSMCLSWLDEPTPLEPLAVTRMATVHGRSSREATNRPWLAPSKAWETSLGCEDEEADRRVCLAEGAS